MNAKRTYWKTVTMGALALLAYGNAETTGVAAAQPASRQIVLSTIQGPDDYYGKWGELVCTEAFRRLNTTLVIKVFPVERANRMVREKQVDGDLGRSSAFHDAYPHLIRVDGYPLSIRLSAFAADPAIRIDGWDNLKGTTYRVEYLRGSKLISGILKPIVAPERLSSVTHWVQGLKKLVAGRTDLFIEAERIVLYYLENDVYFKDADIHIAGMLLETPIYAYLQPEHADLALRLSTVLREMKDEGLVEVYRKKALEATWGTR